MGSVLTAMRSPLSSSRALLTPLRSSVSVPATRAVGPSEQCVFPSKDAGGLVTFPTSWGTALLAPEHSWAPWGLSWVEGRHSRLGTGGGGKGAPPSAAGLCWALCSRWCSEPPVHPWRQHQAFCTLLGFALGTGLGTAVLFPPWLFVSQTFVWFLNHYPGGLVAEMLTASLL